MTIHFKYLLLLFPTICFFYFGLFLAIWLWYPAGLESELWSQHIINFSILYILWLAVFFSYTLFDLTTFRSSSIIVSRLMAAILTCGLISAVYFYFQPEFILTPRRFLLVHLLISMVGIAIWYAFIQNLLPRIWQKKLYFHQQIFEQNLHQPLEEFLISHNTLGWQYAGKFIHSKDLSWQRITIVLPKTGQLTTEELSTLFNYKRYGVEFFEYHRFIENLHRRVDLTSITDAWFIKSISYRARTYDFIKRIMDILVGLFGSAIFLIFYLPVALLIKLNSRGSVLFRQERVGQFGQVFWLLKFRTMSGETTNTWTAHKDSRITKVGRWLRALRLDELPQFINILKGDMSLVGPRPEQVHITKQLIEQIPYFNERHMVKPGLTGWSQLHVYANSIEDTKLKLQYDLYYIKHRSLWFDLEIILRTVFHILTFRGQ